jgi:hypothetical protein
VSDIILPLKSLSIKHIVLSFGGKEYLKIGTIQFNILVMISDMIVYLLKGCINNDFIKSFNLVDNKYLGSIILNSSGIFIFLRSFLVNICNL